MSRAPFRRFTARFISRRFPISRVSRPRFTARRRRALGSPSSKRRLLTLLVLASRRRRLRRRRHPRTFSRDFFPPGFELGHGRRFRSTPPRRRSTRGFRVAILRLPRPELGVGRREVPFPTTRRARRRALVADGVVVAARAFVHRRGSRAKVGRRGWRRQGAKRRRELVVVPRVFRPDARRGVHLGPDLPVSVSASRARARRRLVVRARRAPVPVSLGASRARSRRRARRSRRPRLRGAQLRLSLRLVAVGPVVLVVTGAHVEARVFAPERRRGGSRREWGHRDRVSSGAGREARARGARGRGGLDAPVTTTLSSGAGRARFARNWRSSRARGAGLAERRRRETVSGRGGRRVARVGERREGVRVGSLPDSTTRVARRGTRVLTILTVSEDARPAPDPSVPSFAVRCISRAPPSRSRTSSSSSSATSRAWRPAGVGATCGRG